MDLKTDKWFTSMKMYDTPEADLIMAIAVQARLDATMTIREAPPLPQKAPRKPKRFGWAEWGWKYRDYRQRVKTIKARMIEVTAMKQRKQEARDWLMRPESSFAATVRPLNICPETIRKALRRVYPWARSYK